MKNLDKNVTFKELEKNAVGNKVYFPRIKIQGGLTSAQALLATGRVCRYPSALITSIESLSVDTFVEPVFIKFGRHLTVEDLEKLIALEGFVFADLFVIAKINELWPDINVGNAIQWKNEKEEMIKLLFSTCLGPRSIYASKDTHPWPSGEWRFVCVKK